jgi:hypothetical protein
MENTWKNLGDINFRAYGGCLVRPHWSEEELKKASNPEILKRTFDVFYLNPEMDEEGINEAALCCIDLDDTWFHLDDMLQFIGEDARMGESMEQLIGELSPELLAKELVEYEGIGNFNPEVRKIIDGEVEYLRYPSGEDFLLTDEEVDAWMKEIAPEYL